MVFFAQSPVAQSYVNGEVEPVRAERTGGRLVPVVGCRNTCRRRRIGYQPTPIILSSTQDILQALPSQMCLSVLQWLHAARTNPIMDNDFLPRPWMVVKSLSQFVQQILCVLSLHPIPRSDDPGILGSFLRMERQLKPVPGNVVQPDRDKFLHDRFNWRRVPWIYLENGMREADRCGWTSMLACKKKLFFVAPCQSWKEGSLGLNINRTEAPL